MPDKRRRDHARRNQRRRHPHALQAAAGDQRPLSLCDERATLELAAAGGPNPSPPGTVSMLVYAGGLMTPRFYEYPVVCDLASLSIAAATLPFLFDHDTAQPVGHGAAASDGRQLRASGLLSAAGPAADLVRDSAKGGFPWRVSMGASVGRLEFVEPQQQVQVNNQSFTGPLYVARNAVLHEISFVTIPGDPAATATVAASRPGASDMNFDAWLRAQGLDPDSLSAEQRTSLQAAYQLLPAPSRGPTPPAAGASPTPPAAPPASLAAAAPPAPTPAALSSSPAAPLAAAADPLAEDRTRRAAEVVRCDAIRALCARHPAIPFRSGETETNLEAHAVAQGWSADQTELYLLRAARPAPAIHSRSHETSATLQALQGALMLRSGLALDDRRWRTSQAAAMRLPGWLRAGLDAPAAARALDAAHLFAGYSFVDLCREACRLDGRDTPQDRGEMIQAAFSGGSLSSIFTSSFSARLLATYMEAPDSTLGWTSETDVPDFKTNERVQLAKGGALEKLPRGGEASHYSRSDRAESYKIARYAKQFVVDEQDVIDDRLNALADMPQEMGLAAARLRPDLVYSILKANAALGGDGIALFHASHSNTAAGAALAAATLKAGIQAIGVQRDNAVNLNLETTHLIVPRVLEFTALELAHSTNIVIAGTAGSVTERGSLNTLATKNLDVRSDGRLDNGVTDPNTGTAYAGDADDWFLAAATARTIEIGFLAGTGRVPVVRSFVLDRGSWGLGWDVKFDIGGKALDYRGFYRGQG